VEDAQTGLDYMQQRYYDPGIGRFLSTDPVTAYEKPMTNFNRYVYALNNPYRFTDPDGREFESINPANNQKLEGYINSQAAGEFKFNDSNKLERVGDGNGSGSQTYNDSLVQGIASDKTTLIAIQPTVGNVNVADRGNGLTGQVGDKIAVVINDQSLNTVDAAGAPLVDSPATILEHEIAGHAVPQMMGQPNANAVGIDNQIRSELRTPQIPADPTHKAYDPP
jgi:RHS repeat-associated protein